MGPPDQMGEVSGGVVKVPCSGRRGEGRADESPGAHPPLVHGYLRHHRVIRRHGVHAGGGESVQSSISSFTHVYISLDRLFD